MALNLGVMLQAGFRVAFAVEDVLPGVVPFCGMLADARAGHFELLCSVSPAVLPESSCINLSHRNLFLLGARPRPGSSVCCDLCSTGLWQSAPCLSRLVLAPNMWVLQPAPSAASSPGVATLVLSGHMGMILQAGAVLSAITLHHRMD